MATFLDYEWWPRAFPLTIGGTELVRCWAPFAFDVIVHHRKEGRVLNVLTVRSPEVVELEESKRRFDATFVNRFARAPDGAGTRYTIDVEVRITPPCALLAPLLRGVVKRALRRCTLEPMRVAAEER